jgi:hypothetical protein
MNEVFDVMPFGAPGGATQLEQERGGRGGGGRGFGGGARGPGGNAARGAAPRMGLPRGWPRNYPRYYPITGGGPWWGYPLAYQPYPPPEWPDWRPREPGTPEDMDDELPPAFVNALSRLPAAQRPIYRRLGLLPEVVRGSAANGPGLYLIVFRDSGPRQAYHGHSGNVRRRLQQHLLCATMVGADASRFQVYMASTPPGSGAESERRRRIELAIHNDMLQRHRGLLTNQRRELELELLGEAWR